MLFGHLRSLSGERTRLINGPVSLDCYIPAPNPSPPLSTLRKQNVQV
jgi:hypothetical protein